MTRAGRRRLYVIGAVLLVATLVGGRWLAVETAERAWDQTFAGGTAIIEARDLARLLQALVLVVSIAWITGNLLVVYRAIGSVQMPHRLGDLEIVEAVPQRALLGATVLLGVVLGSLFALGTGDWWRHAVLAASPPHFGIPDATEPGRDVGYYVSTLPWLAVLQNRALILAVGALGIITVLYAVIGSLRFRHGRVRASEYARAHAGVLLACLALVIAWGALLDPAEVIAGLHGPVDEASLAVRAPGSRVVAAVAVVTAGISIAWAWRDRPTLIIAGWAALLISLTTGYFVIPGVVRASRGIPGGGEGARGESTELARRRIALERMAFGLTALDDSAPPPPAFPSGEAALRTMPLWDPIHVGRAAGDGKVSVALRPPRPDDNGAAWLVASPTGPVQLALETDTRLAVTPLPTSGPSPVFGPGLDGAPVTAPDSLRTTGMPITGVWRRIAIAWTIDWGLARGDSNGRVLLWRRDVTDRLERLAPFARFGDPTPALRDGGLWWVSWGYVSHEAFPLVRPLEWRDHDVRYFRAGLIGAVHAGTGETHLWLAPGYDSLTASWARRFEPLIEPADRLPPDLRVQLAYPSETFKLAVAHLLRASADSGGDAAAWTARPREPFQLGGPPPDGGGGEGGKAGGGLWTAIAFESGLLTPKRFVGLYAATITAHGLEQRLWRPSSEPERLPGELLGSTTLRPGQLRMWLAGNSIITLQAQLFEPLVASNASSPPPTLPPPRVAEVYVTLDGRSGRGLTARAALRGGEQIVTDTTLAARWQRARRLAAQADSALGVGDLEAFSRLWRALMSELAPLQRPR